MNMVRAVLLVVLTVGGTVTAATLAAAVGPAADTATVEADDTANAEVAQTQSSETAENRSNDTFGSKVTSFMQTSASQTQGTVDTEMWVSSFNNSTNQTERADLVDQQTSELERKLESIKVEKRQLVEKKQAGNISQVEFRAKMSQVVGQYISLTDAINTTEPLAESVGVNESSFETLRQDARNLTGPEVAAVAQNLDEDGAPGLQQRANSSRPEDVPANGASQGNRPNLVDNPGQAAENQTIPGQTGNQTGNSNGIPNQGQDNVTLANGAGNDPSVADGTLPEGANSSVSGQSV